MKEEEMKVSYNRLGILNVTVDGRVESMYLMNFISPLEENHVSSRIYAFSPNQRKTIIAKMENLIDGYDTGDCPTLLRVFLNTIKEVGSEMQKGIIFEDELEVAQITRKQTEKSNKQTVEEEVLLRGTDCILALRRFDRELTHFDDCELVKVVIRRDK